MNFVMRLNAKMAVAACFRGLFQVFASLLCKVGCLHEVLFFNRVPGLAEIVLPISLIFNRFNVSLPCRCVCFWLMLAVALTSLVLEFASYFPCHLSKKAETHFSTIAKFLGYHPYFMLIASLSASYSHLERGKGLKDKALTTDEMLLPAC